MRALRPIVGAAFALLAGSVASTPSAAQEQPLSPTLVSGPMAARADSALLVEAGKGFSGAVLVVSKGQIILQKGYGLAVKKPRTPFTPNTIVQIGSNVKDFTAVAILQLQVAGKLSVTDSLGKFFPKAPADKRGITIQQLMDHRSGFEPNLPGGDFRALTRDDFLAAAFASKLIYAPGQGERYSNLGFSLLAAIIEVTTGDSYGTYLQKNIWQPLGMTWTGLLFPQYDTTQVAHGYSGTEDDGTLLQKPHAKDGPYWNQRGNGGYLSTVSEMYGFYDALFNSEKLLPASARAGRFDANQPMILAGSDMISFFLYDREPQAGVVIIVASNMSDFPAPRARDAIATVMGLPVPKGREVRRVAAGTAGVGSAAAAAAGKPFAWPETPAARRAHEWMALFNAGDSAAAVGFIRDSIIKAPNEQRTPEQRAGGLRGMRGRLGKLTPLTVVSSTPTSIEITVAAENEPSATLTFEVEAAVPYRIAQLGIRVE
jgi:CubicO group peptidase (beta-lactamase class C family)